MSIAPETSTDFQDDLLVPVGTDLFYQYSIQPFDGTGCSAQFITTFGTFAVTISVAVEGDQPITTFSVSVPNASLTVPGIYTWKILVTFPLSPPVVLQYGHGGLRIEAF